MTTELACLLLWLGALALGILAYWLTGFNPVKAAAVWLGNKIADFVFGRGGSPR